MDPDPGFSKHPDMLCGRTIPFDTIAIACKKSTRRLFTSRATSPRACRDKGGETLVTDQDTGTPVGNDKDAGPGEEVQGHGGDLCRVLVPVFHGQARGHHVTIVDCLHLVGITI